MKTLWLAPFSLLLVTGCETSSPLAHSPPLASAPGNVAYTPASRIPGQKYIELPFPSFASDVDAATVPTTQEVTTDPVIMQQEQELAPQQDGVMQMPYPSEDSYSALAPGSDYAEPYYYNYEPEIASGYEPYYYPNYYYPVYYAPYFYYGSGALYYHHLLYHNDHPSHPIYNFPPNRPPTAPVVISPIRPRPTPHPADAQNPVKIPRNNSFASTGQPPHRPAAAAQRSGTSAPTVSAAPPVQSQFHPYLGPPVYTTSSRGPVMISPRTSAIPANMVQNNSGRFAPPIPVAGNGTFQSAVPPTPYNGGAVPPAGAAPPIVTYNAAPPAAMRGGYAAPGPAAAPAPAQFAPDAFAGRPAGNSGLTPIQYGPPISTMSGPIRVPR